MNGTSVTGIIHDMVIFVEDLNLKLVGKTIFNLHILWLMPFFLLVF